MSSTAARTRNELELELSREELYQSLIPLVGPNTCTLDFSDELAVELEVTALVGLKKAAQSRINALMRSLTLSAAEGTEP